MNAGFHFRLGRLMILLARCFKIPNIDQRRTNEHLKEVFSFKKGVVKWWWSTMMLFFMVCWSRVS